MRIRKKNNNEGTNTLNDRSFQGVKVMYQSDL